MNNQLMQNKQAFKAMLEDSRFKAKFEQALGKSASLFIASLSEVYANNEQLAACDQNAIALEALKAATLQLPINKALGYSYMLVFNNKKKMPDGTYQSVPTPTLVIGYKGYIQLAQRTGAYKFINADVVYEGEFVSQNKLTGEINITGEKKSSKIAGYFAYFKTVNGFEKSFFMTLDEMIDYALHYSPSFKGKNTPSKKSLKELAQSQEDNGTSSGQGWTGDFKSMAIKVCLSQLLRKYGYLSIEMQSAMTGDDDPISRDEEVSMAQSNAKSIEDVEAEIVNEQPATEQPANSDPY